MVLSHFDELKIGGIEFRYFRYVDDIRLFAKKEHDLRRLLVSLGHVRKCVYFGTAPVRLSTLAQA